MVVTGVKNEKKFRERQEEIDKKKSIEEANKENKASKDTNDETKDATENAEATTMDVSDIFGAGTEATVVDEISGALPDENTVIGADNNNDNTPVIADNPAPTDSAIVEDESITSAGDIKCYAYFAMEITKESLSGEPFTIGILTDDNKTFYAEFLDFDHTILNTPHLLILRDMYYPYDVTEGDHWTVTGDKEHIGKALMKFLKENYEAKGRVVQFIGDKLYIEFVLLMELLLQGKSISELPEWIIRAPIDFNSELRTSVSAGNYNGFDNYVPNYNAYISNRDDLLIQYCTINNYRIPEVTNRRNVIYSAFRTRFLYLFMWSLYKDDKYYFEIKKYNKRIRK